MFAGGKRPTRIEDKYYEPADDIGSDAKLNLTSSALR